MKLAYRLAVVALLMPSVAANAAETITYKYDAKGRLIEVKRTGTVNNNVTTTYTHDKADNRKNVTTTGSPNAPPPP
jgi:RHS Repeat